MADKPSGPFYTSGKFVRGPARPSGSGFKEMVFELPSERKATMTAESLNEFFAVLAPFSGLSPAEVERLALLAEEMGEAIQVVGKVLRHGYESHNPNDPAHTTNRQLLMHELGDVRHSVERMCDADDVSKQIIGVRAHMKGKRVQQYLHHQPTNQGESE